MTALTDDLQIGALVTSSKGAKMAFISCENAPALWLPSDAMLPVFEPKPFEEDATRINLVLQPTPEQEAELKSLDDWCLSTVAKRSEQLFGKVLTLEQLAPCYQPCLKTSDKYPPNLRVKVNLSGTNATRYWNAMGRRTIAPDTWIGNAVKPRIRIKALWFMAKQFGIVMELTDAQILEAEIKCPFSNRF